MRQFILAATLFTALAGAACAPTDAGPADMAATGAAPERQCFFPQQIDNFRQGEGQTLYLKAQRGVYEVQSAGYCRDLDFTIRMAIQPEMGSSRLCTGDWATIIVPGSVRSLETCRVQIVKRLTEAEVAALPGRSRP